MTKWPFILCVYYLVWALDRRYWRRRKSKRAHVAGSVQLKFIQLRGARSHRPVQQHDFEESAAEWSFMVTCVWTWSSIRCEAWLSAWFHLLQHQHTISLRLFKKYCAFTGHKRPTAATLDSDRSDPATYSSSQSEDARVKTCFFSAFLRISVYSSIFSVVFSVFASPQNLFICEVNK